MNLVQLDLNVLYSLLTISVRLYMLDMVQPLAVHSLYNCYAIHRGLVQAPMTNICNLQYDHKMCDSVLHLRCF